MSLEFIKESPPKEKKAMGRLQEDDDFEDENPNPFSSFKIERKVDAGSVSTAKFQGTGKFVSTDQHVALKDDDVMSFGEQEKAEIKRTPLGQQNKYEESKGEYKSFKQNPKFNKYVSKPKEATIGGGKGNKPVVDARMEQIIFNNDVGEVAEWEGKTLNRKAQKDEDDDSFGAKKNQDDSDDFEAAFDQAFKGAQTPAKETTTIKTATNDEELLKQRIQKKLEGNNLGNKAGGGTGGLANRLANKQKELQEKKAEAPVIRSIAEKRDPIVKVEIPKTPLLEKKDSPKLKPNEEEIEDLKVGKKKETRFIKSQVEEDDEWKEVNKVAKETAVSIK